MPKIDGIAAAAQITEARIAPVVMLTAFSQRDLVERARDAGAMAYLVKPFQKRDLLPAIEMATSRFAEIRALEAEVTGLRERLEARKLIERAKGVLMTQHGLSEPEAFRWIQRAAMDNRTSMRAVAELVLSGDAGGASGRDRQGRHPTGRERRTGGRRHLRLPMSNWLLSPRLGGDLVTTTDSGRRSVPGRRAIG